MRFGEAARGIRPRWLTAAAAVVFAAFTAMLALGVISPLEVQGADQPIDDNGQAADFQPAMVTDVSVTSTTQDPGDVSGYEFRFTTPDALTANEDTITVHFDKDFRDLNDLSREHVTVSVSAASYTNGPMNTGAFNPPSNPMREILDRDKHGLSDSAALDNVEYTFYVPDMNGDNEGAPGIAAGATVTVTVSQGAGIRNPTKAGSKGPIGVFTSRQPMMVSTTVPVALVMALSSYGSNRNKALTVVGWGFKNGTTATIYLDRSRGNDGEIVNMPDGVRTPGVDTDLGSTVVEADDTFTFVFTVTVPPFAPEGVNQVNVIDDDNPPNHYNGMDGQAPVIFTIKPLLSISPSPVAVGQEVEITLVDWPATDRVMDYITADSQGVDRVIQSAVTIAGVPQRITFGKGPIGPGDEHNFLIQVGAAVPAGIHELRVKTYTADQVMSNVPGGASDTKRITITGSRSVEGDRAALAALYNATGGANWTNNTNWLTGAPLGQWYGVETDANGRVMLLYLGSNQLSGEIPAELGNLTNLAVLYLGNNQLTGCVPAGLRHVAYNDFAELGLPFCGSEGVAGDGAALVALYNATDGANWTNNTNWLTDAPLYQWHGVSAGANGRVMLLYLGSNQLSGEIPAELADLTSLEALFLSDNGLSGEIPMELSSLTNLTRLSLSQNQLTGHIPLELGSLTNLEILDLRSNQLTGTIPMELGSLTNLEILDLHSNQLTGTIPMELSNLISLTELDLSENRLNREIPGELGNLTNLTHLYLYENELSGEMPMELGSLANLYELWLANNQLSGGIPAELGKLTNLNKFLLNSNQLSGGIPAELGGLTSLVWLLLNNNQLSGGIPAELGGLTNLEGLVLDNNQLSGGIPTELGNLTNLEHLYLSSNRLTGCVPASLRSPAYNDLAGLGLPFCDMLDGSPVVVVGFVSEAGAPVRLGSQISLEATFSEPVSGFALEDVRVVNGVAGNFAGSGAVYTFDVTPNAIGEVTVNIAAGAAEDTDARGNIAASLSLGIPYDDDGDGMIEKGEIIAAINDYLFDGTITKEQVIALINLYLFG